MSNISNCGLVTECNGKTYIADVKNYTGTFVLDMFGNLEKVISEALMWYSAVDGRNIYFSNQKHRDFLCVYDSVAERLGVLQEIACKNIVKYEKKLYFIEEESKNILCCSIVGGAVEKVSDIKTEVFSICGDFLYYSSASGIGVINLKNKAEYAVLSTVGEVLGIWNTYLLFSDFKKDSVLSIYQPKNGGFFRVDAIKTDSFLTCENYIYAINRNEVNSICRIDISKGEIMRIYGESAYNLHIIDKYLYFLDNEDNWCKISVMGDNFTKLRIN